MQAALTNSANCLSSFNIIRAYNYVVAFLRYKLQNYINIYV
jgi:hypothetical protein